MEPENIIFFDGVKRPHIQKYVIPTIWDEGGIGLFGSMIPELNYRLYYGTGGAEAPAIWCVDRSGHH